MNRIRIAFVALFLVMPLAYPTRAPAATCTAPFRAPTAAEIAAVPSLKDRCVDSVSGSVLNADAINDAVTYLNGKICAGKQAGFDSTIPKSELKEKYVYFKATENGRDLAINPNMLQCVKKLMQAAESAGLQPCLSAGLRTPDAQVASCMDRSNSTVCGRQNGCKDVSFCPHVKGIAVDFNVNDYGKLHALAQSMGMTVPLPAADKYHIEGRSGTCSDPRFVPKTTDLTPSPGAFTPAPSSAPSFPLSGLGTPSAQSFSGIAPYQPTNSALGSLLSQPAYSQSSYAPAYTQSSYETPSSYTQAGYQTPTSVSDVARLLPNGGTGTKPTTTVSTSSISSTTVIDLTRHASSTYVVRDPFQEQAGIHYTHTRDVATNSSPTSIRFQNSIGVPEAGQTFERTDRRSIALRILSELRVRLSSILATLLSKKTDTSSTDAASTTTTIEEFPD